MRRASRNDLAYELSSGWCLPAARPWSRRAMRRSLLVAAWWLSRGRLIDPLSLPAHPSFLPAPLVRHAYWRREQPRAPWLPGIDDPMWALPDRPRRAWEPGVREQLVADALHHHLSSQFPAATFAPPSGVGRPDPGITIIWSGPVSMAEVSEAIEPVRFVTAPGGDVRSGRLTTPAGPIDLLLAREPDR